MFVGKDVAQALGYANTRKAVLDHVDKEDREDGVTIRDAIGRDQKATFINESGLYALILSSKLPQAKACSLSAKRSSIRSSVSGSRVYLQTVPPRKA